MNAQMILDNSDKLDFNPRQFRKEINISFLIKDAVKEFRRQNE